jgi:hypothetical protein
MQSKILGNSICKIDLFVPEILFPGALCLYHHWGLSEIISYKKQASQL